MSDRMFHHFFRPTALKTKNHDDTTITKKRGFRWAALRAVDRGQPVHKALGYVVGPGEPVCPRKVSDCARALVEKCL